ncbi:MAG TPA: DUF6702 family protein [Saprospiraceae bacterium]|nr:DUF6702 family protein [Saprospiraceae bacterium]
MQKYTFAILWSWILLAGLSGSCSARCLPNAHPFYISVTEIHFNPVSQKFEISVKLFTDDFEKVLRQIHHQSVNLLEPGDAERMQQWVDQYILGRLKIIMDRKEIVLTGLGSEREEEAYWSYFESDACSLPKQVEIRSTLLHDAFQEQINIVHLSIGSFKKSFKLDYPESVAKFDL